LVVPTADRLRYTPSNRRRELRRRAEVDTTVRIGVVGDYNPSLRMHVAIGASHQHAAEMLGRNVRTEWVPTEAISRENAEGLLGRFHGLWIAPASPYRSMEGALAAIEFARKRGRPMVGT
jgi:CTP synthase (UTP-ammonia lyase)